MTVCAAVAAVSRRLRRTSSLASLSRRWSRSRRCFKETEADSTRMVHRLYSKAAVAAVSRRLRRRIRTASIFSIRAAAVAAVSRRLRRSDEPGSPSMTRLPQSPLFQGD